jgi:hypothetical protein
MCPYHTRCACGRGGRYSLEGPEKRAALNRTIAVVFVCVRGRAVSGCAALLALQPGTRRCGAAWSRTSGTLRRRWRSCAARLRPLTRCMRTPVLRSPRFCDRHQTNAGGVGPVVVGLVGASCRRRADVAFSRNEFVNGTHSVFGSRVDSAFCCPRTLHSLHLVGGVVLPVELEITVSFLAQRPSGIDTGSPRSTCC